MIEYLTEKITDLVNDFVLKQEEKIKGFINNKLKEKTLEKRLEESSKRFFDEKIENSMSIEEINFPALNEYVKEELCKQIKDILLELDLNKKEKDKEIFLNSCINISGAETENEKRIVKLYVEIAIDIIKSFFIGENPESLRALFSEVSENIEKHIDKSTEEIKEAVKNSTDKNSFEYLIDSINPKTPSTSPFHFRNDILIFQGRKYEQKEIYNFLEDERKLLWMAITGDGGSGKSKLMYHMTQKLESGSEWKVIWLEDESLKSILEKTEFKYSKNLLFICDYGGQFSEKLRTLINRIDTFGNKDSGKKIRLIILEREGFAENCGEILEPMWYRNFCGDSSQNGRVNSTAFDKNKSMNLKPLNDDDFKGIVKDYLTEKKKSLSDEKINTVIKKAHEIDDRKTGARPLILLFVADAVAEGNEAENWDLNKLVEHVIKRYENHWKNVICKGDEELYEAVKEITAYATAVGGWDLRNKKIGEPIKSDIDLFFKKVNDKNMFLCGICEKTETDGIWTPFEPDLLGEFFVLEFLSGKIQNYDDEYVTNFSDICWENGSVLFAWFLSHCAQNYCRQERFNTIFANGMEIFEPKDEENAVWYSYLLVDMTACQTMENVGETAKKLKSMSQKYSYNQKILTEYAKGLVNLSCIQELKEREKTIEKLKELWRTAPDNKEAKTRYAKGLFNLSNVQELKERKKTIEELEELWKSAPKNREIQTEYAKGLYNLNYEQDLKEMEKTIEKLEELWKLASENQEVQTAYAYGLYNLSCFQELKEKEKTIAKLKLLWESNKENQEVQIEYADGLVNLIGRHELIKDKQTMKQLETLWKRNPEKREIRAAYARGLANLSDKQNLSEIGDTIDKLKYFENIDPQNSGIQSAYMLGVMNKTLKKAELYKTKEPIESDIAEIKKYVEEHKDNEELQKIYNQFLDELNKLLP